MIRNFIQKVRGGASRTKLQVLLTLLAGVSLLTPSVAHAGPVDSAVSWVVNGAAGVVGGFIGTIAIPIAILFLTISNFVLWVCGLVFNWAVIRTVFQFGTYFGTSDEMLIAWGVMRDVANIGLLFGFIFMGVLLILNVEGGGHGHGGGISAKKAIPRLLIFAVLVNFSLFTTQAVIDVSNGLASVFAEQAGQKCDTSLGVEKCANLGIASVISQRAGITTIWSGGPPVTNPLKTAVVYVGLSIFVMITAMVLLAGAIMFVYRAVVLSFLMVTSPIGFAGMAIPSLKKIADEWWSKLISQSFFAPVYLLLIFISLKLTETLADVSVEGGGKGSLASALAGTGGEAGTEAGNIQIVLVFMVVIGFMMASLVTANKMGAVGAKFATKTAGALTLGTAGFVGRRTLGRASGVYADYMRRTGKANAGLGKQFTRLADYGNTSSFSLRNVANKVPGSVDFGKTNKAASHGYHGIEEDEVKKKEAWEKKTREAQMKDAPSSKINDEVRQAEKEILEDLDDALKNEVAAIHAQQEQVSKAREKVNAAKTDAERDAAKAQLTADRTELGKRMGVYNKKKKILLEGEDGKGGDPRFSSLKEMKKAAKDLRQGDERNVVNAQIERLEVEAHPNIFVDLTTMQKAVAHHTVEKIIKEINTSDIEKAIKNATKPKDGDGGGGAPDPHPPSPGGGTPSGDDHPH